MKKTDDHSNQLLFYNVKYILTTGANWAGPIENFTLNLLYPSGGAITYNHFYKNKNAKVTQSLGKTTILLSDFIPGEDLNIIFATTSSSKSQWKLIK